MTVTLAPASLAVLVDRLAAEVLARGAALVDRIWLFGDGALLGPALRGVAWLVVLLLTVTAPTVRARRRT